MDTVLLKRILYGVLLLISIYILMHRILEIIAFLLLMGVANHYFPDQCLIAWQVINFIVASCIGFFK